LNGYYKFLEQLIPATVNIHALAKHDHPSASMLGTERSGSGTLIDPHGHILTVSYVVLGAEALTVTLQRGEEASARVVYIDFESGLALLQADVSAAYHVPVSDSGGLEIGQMGLLLASTEALERRVTEGVITGLEPFDAHWEYMLDRAILTTAENPGFGGGAFVTLGGIMTGVVSLNLGGLKDASMIIPLDAFLGVRDEVIAHGRVRSRVPRAWIGVHPMPSPRGLIIFGVTEHGPADRAGVQPGDILVSVGDQEVGDRVTLYQRLWAHQAGEEVPLIVLREGRRHVLVIQSQDRAEFWA
jgi:S1-C subfamily serine protease